MVAGQYPIAVVNTLNGSFIVDGVNWIPKPENLTDDKIQAYYDSIVTKPLKQNKDLPDRQWKVKSKSDPTKEYNVRWWSSFWTCECEGFYYRKNCSHIDFIKQSTS